MRGQRSLLQDLNWRLNDTFRANHKPWIQRLLLSIQRCRRFAEDELDYLLCGQHELWVTEELVDHTKSDHGYMTKNPPIVNLLQIMGEFTPEHQRAFYRFVAGAPRLPPRGFVVLNLKITIVRSIQ